jgi:hypothetical protein
VECTVRHCIRENMRVGAPITLEPGPDSISVTATLPRTGLRITPPPEASRKPLEAILAALIAYKRSVSEQLYAPWYRITSTGWLSARFIFFQQVFYF